MTLHLKRRITGYIGTIQPLLADLLKYFKYRSIVVVASSFMAVSFELAALAALYTIFSNGGKTKGIFSKIHIIPSGSDTEQLLSSPILFLPIILFTISALMHFWSNVDTINLANDFALRTFRCLHEGLRRAKIWPQGEYTRDFCSFRKINRIQKNALMVNSRAIRIIISMIKPLMYFLGGYLFLLYINTGFGVAITTTLVLLLGIQAAVGFRSARNNIKWESLAPKLSANLKKELSTKLNRQAETTEEKSMRIAGKILSARRNLLIMTTYSQAASSAAFIVTLTVILLYFRYMDSTDIRNNLSAVLAMLIVITRMFMSFKSVAGQITVINRFYPQLNRFYRLARILGNQQACSGGSYGEVSSRSILTNLPDNHLNRLRWRSLLFGGKNVEFGNNPAELQAHLYSDVPEEGFDEEYIWVDMEKMRNEPPVLCKASDTSCLDKHFYKNRLKEDRSRQALYEDDEDEDDV